MNNILNNLINTTYNSGLIHKHASIGLKKGKAITPYFCNYKRIKMKSYVCGSFHAEISVINYLLNLWNFDINILSYKNNNNNKALKKIKRKFKKIKIIVIRYSGGNIVLSKPCLMCLDLMKKLRIKYIVYSDYNGVMINKKVNKLNTNHLSQLTICIKNNKTYKK